MENCKSAKLYPIGYNQNMKPVCFLGDSLECLRDFPEDARHDAGYQLDKVQRGEQPDDFKPMPGVGKGVEEIRVHGRERCVPGDLYRPAG
jgi:phage-related protein